MRKLFGNPYCILLGLAIFFTACGTQTVPKKFPVSVQNLTDDAGTLYIGPATFKLQAHSRPVQVVLELEVSQVTEGMMTGPHAHQWTGDVRFHNKYDDFLLQCTLVSDRVSSISVEGYSTYPHINCH
ncbi:MAG: hypothetical protein WA051_01165 [Minisyncoccia bacterium]